MQQNKTNLTTGKFNLILFKKQLVKLKNFYFSADPYSLNNFESNYSMWAINVKNLTLRINLGASKSCLNSAFLTFEAFFSGPNQTPFGFVSISSTQCIANVTNNQRHTYGDLSMSCNQHSNGTNSQVEVSITLENQNSALNSTYVRLELRPTASRDALSVQSQTIIFKSKFLFCFSKAEAKASSC